MESMLRISDAASIGLHAMARLAGAPDGEPLSACRMATDLQVSEAHLSKVLQRLGRRGLVHSKRGPGGGFVLGRNPDSITLEDVYTAVEGPLPITHCLLGRAECALHQDCLLGHLLLDIQDLVNHEFSHVTLAEALDPNGRKSWSKAAFMR